MESEDLKKWVSDEITSMLGDTRGSVIQYITSLMEETTSHADIKEKLEDIGLPSSSKTLAFAEEIFSKSGLDRYQNQEREAAMFARKQKSYVTLDADDDEDGVNGIGGGKSSLSVAFDGSEVDRPMKRSRKKIESQDDDDEDFAQGVEKRVQRKIHSSEDDGFESEEERLRDPKERDQLERNIREGDAAGTRKLTDSKLTRREEEAIWRSEQNELETLRDPSAVEKMNSFAEQEAWEEHQISKANLKDASKS